ncbi:hypothetical protein PRIC2_014504 [Phytophthora ramorum]
MGWPDATNDNSNSDPSAAVFSAGAAHTPTANESSSAGAVVPSPAVMTMTHAATSSTALVPTSSRDATPDSTQQSTSVLAHLRAPRLTEIEGTALHGLLMDASEETSDRLSAVLGSRLTDAVRCITQLMLNPPRHPSHVRNRKIADAQSISDLVAALGQPEEDPRNLVEELGQLQAQVKDAQAAKEAAERAAFGDKMKLETAQLLLAQSQAENAKLSRSVTRANRLRIASDRQFTEQAAQMAVHSEVVAQATARLKAADDSLQALERKLNLEREHYKKNLALFSDRVNQLHRHLTHFGDAAADRSQRALLKDMKFTVAETLKANQCLRQYVDQRDLDADTLLVLSKGGCVGELDFALLGLDSEAIAIVRDAVQELDPSLTPKASARRIASLVHHLRDDTLGDSASSVHAGVALGTVDSDTDIVGGGEGEVEGRNGPSDSSPAISPSSVPPSSVSSLGKRSRPQLAVVNKKPANRKSRKTRSAAKATKKVGPKTVHVQPKIRFPSQSSGRKIRSKPALESSPASLTLSEVAVPQATSASLPTTPRSTVSTSSVASNIVLSSAPSSPSSVISTHAAEAPASRTSRRRSTRAAAALSRQRSASVIALEAVDNDFILGFGTPVSSLPGSPESAASRPRYSEISEEEKEGGQSTEVELGAVEQGADSHKHSPVRQSAGGSRAPYTPVPMSALDPVAVRSAHRPLSDADIHPGGMRWSRRGLRKVSLAARIRFRFQTTLRLRLLLILAFTGL